MKEYLIYYFSNKEENVNDVIKATSSIEAIKTFIRKTKGKYLVSHSVLFHDACEESRHSHGRRS